jgi:hypothetical protein
LGFGVVPRLAVMLMGVVEPTHKELLGRKVPARY